MSKQYYSVIIFPGITQALQAEKVLKSNKIIHKLIPVPRNISSNCGVCIRIRRRSAESAVKMLGDASVAIDGLFSI